MSTPNNFLVEEYENLWKDFGVETLPHFALTSFVQKSQLCFIGEECEENAGELLNKIIEAMGYAKEDVAILNISKSFETEIEKIQPRVCIALGSLSTATLLETKIGIATLRGRFHPMPSAPSILVMPTFHPNYLLKNPAAKKLVWEDMKLVMKQLEKSL